jgi:hypothetical protein
LQLKYYLQVLTIYINFILILIFFSIILIVQPLLIDRSLNKQQFQLVVCLVRSLISIVLSKRTVELEMDPILFTDSNSNTTNIDPFQHAKKILVDADMKTTTDSMIGKSSTSSSNSSVFDLPPPPPLSAVPPPPVSVVPPAPVSSVSL